MADAQPAKSNKGARRWPPAPLARLGVVIGLGLVILVSTLAMGPPTNTMAKDGASVTKFEFAGTSAKAEQIRNQYGHDGRRAAWWQLAIDLPFMLGYGLLLCAGCWYAARELAAVGTDRLAKLALAATVLGPLAAACDLVQNVALAFVLSGHAEQPAPRLSELCGYLTFFFAICAGAVFVGGSLLAAASRRGLSKRQTVEA